MAMNSLRIILPLLLCLSIFLYCGKTDNSEVTKKDTGQIIKYRITVQNYVNASGETGITYYYYNSDGINDKCYWTLLDSTRFSHNWYTYERRGNLLRKYREFSEGRISSNIYKYDQNDLLVEELFERSDSVSGRVTYTYDDRGHPLTADCQGLNGWFYGFIEYQTDEHGRKISASISKDTAQIGTITYTYDENGNLLKEHWDFPDIWYQTFEYEYVSYMPKNPPSYTSANVFITNTADFQIIGENYSYNGEQGGPSSYEYDEAGKLLKKVFERSDGFRTETTFQYDPEGFLVTSRRNYNNGLTGTFTYEYNGNRRLIKRLFERSDSVIGSEIYKYDFKLNLIGAEFVNFDGWLTGTLTFEHDDSGRFTGGTFDGQDLDAEISFKYDGSGSIIQIRWDFSNGQYQIYDFEYRKL